MHIEIYRKRIQALYQRFYFYPPHKPLKHGVLFWLSMSVVTAGVIWFCAYFISYMFARHDAFMTNAEDFGIMTQAIWNTTQGNMLQQTICNIISDTNCASPEGLTRFAIHFEPIFFPIALIYAIVPNPKTLLFIQTVVVAIGAFPAFWLARLRLRNEIAGVAIAALYLLYPALEFAVSFDFHAVTFTASFLLFMLYFMYTRRTIWMFVFAILAMACKEQMPIVIVLFGAWIMLFQQRWKSGLGLITLGGIWLVMGLLVIMPFYSPTGKPLLASRYDQSGGITGILKNAILHPRAFINSYIREPGRAYYLQVVLSPAGLPDINGKPFIYLSLLAPWVFILAVPSLAIILFSSNSNMYSGIFHYNAEIVPILIFATIESLVLMTWLARKLYTWLYAHLARLQSSPFAFLQNPRWKRAASSGFLLFLCSGILFSSIRAEIITNWHIPWNSGHVWPQSNERVRLAERFVEMVPANVSISAQTHLAAHLSHRRYIYMFPYQAEQAEYVLLDIQGDRYPFADVEDYMRAVKHFLQTGSHGIVAAQDGFLLLKRGVKPLKVLTTLPTGVSADEDYNPGLISFAFPDSFCENIYVSEDQISQPLKATFKANDGELSLVGYDLHMPDTFQRKENKVEVTTYWRVERPIATPLQIRFTLQGSDGHEYAVKTDMPLLNWCQTNTWKPGSIVRMKSNAFGLEENEVPNGLAHMSMVLLPVTQSSSTIMDVQDRLPVRILNAPNTVTASQGTNTLQLKSVNIVE